MASQTTTPALPDRVDVVIIGGGIIGCSIAYHLARRGVAPLLLERRRLTCGTTWHAAGLVGQLRATLNLTRLAQYSAQLYEQLAAESGQATGFRRTGSISIAGTPDRLVELRRLASMAALFGLPVQELTPADIRGRFPLINAEGIVGGVFLPTDGVTNPVDTTLALAAAARARGARIDEETKVTALIRDDGRVAGVVSTRGEVRAPVVVLAAGMWSRDFAAAHDVVVPLHAAEHFYIVTEPIPGLSGNLPVLRDPDNCFYVKEDAGKLLLGCFEPTAKPWGAEGIPEDFCFDQLPADVDHFQPILERAIRRLPVLEGAGIKLFFNGPESFTPDTRYILGEAPDLPGLFVAAGFNSIGIQSAGGAGRAVADWIIDGHPGMDLWDVDIRRFHPFQRNRAYLHARTKESLGLLYAMHWPFRQNETARGVRRSAVHDRLAAQGAAFGEVAGWERANWFVGQGASPGYDYSFGRPHWFEASRAEHLAVRHAVGLFDLSSFGKFHVQGRDALAVLNRIGTAEHDVPAGRIVHTQWLNQRGGIEADLTITRLDEREFLVVTGAATHIRDLSHLRRAAAGADCTVTDLTSAYAVFGVMGPQSRALLAGLTSADLSNVAFPFRSSREIDLGFARVRAARISYVGELGWELYVPTEFAQHVFDCIMEAGAAFGLRPAGYYALDSLRLEKAYRHWGHDIDSDTTLMEAGLDLAAAWEKPAGFIGREALLARRGAGHGRRVMQFLLGDARAMLFHDEPIWRDGVRVGRVTSAMYGHSLGAPVALGLVAAADAAGQWEIEIAGVRVPATASLTPLYDPSGVRIRDG
jgi:glycine cleavage system aminomethyltransferase T/glycine/D-amino acid oxidase-like deaminating enzyme